jgi:WD40 repeat protein
MDSIAACYGEYYANVERGVHTLSQQSTAAREQAREAVRRFLNAPSAEEIVFVRGTTEAINLVAWSFVRPRLGPDDEVLITGPVLLTADGRFAALNCGDGGAQLWDTTELRPVGRPILDRYRGLAPVAIDPNGRWLFGIGSEGWLCAWDASSGQRIWQLDQLELGMNWVAAAMTSDSRRVVVSAPIGVAHSELSEWNFEPNTNSARAVGKRKTAVSVLPRRTRIMELTFSRSGNRLLIGDLEGHLGTIEFATREGSMFNAEHDGRVTWLGLSADGQQLATTSVDGTARLWRAPTLQEIERAASQPQKLKP